MSPHLLLKNLPHTSSICFKQQGCKQTRTPCRYSQDRSNSGACTSRKITGCNPELWSERESHWSPEARRVQAEEKWGSTASNPWLKHFKTKVSPQALPLSAFKASSRASKHPRHITSPLRFSDSSCWGWFSNNVMTDRADVADADWLPVAPRLCVVLSLLHWVILREKTLSRGELGCTPEQIKMSPRANH